MPVTAIEGIVENGRIRLREDVILPDKTRVYVLIVDSAEGRVFHVGSPRLAHPEQAKDFRKQILEVPPDAQL